MIDIAAKIHDKFSIEFKVGFHIRRKLKKNDFAINTWIFIPNSLDINTMTYSKNMFYRDVKSNIRLITPIFLLREIASDGAMPLHNLEKTFHTIASDPTRSNIREYEYHIKMFGLYLLNGDDSVSVIQGEKVYYLNIVMQLYFDESVSYKRFRVVFTQAGVKELEELG